MTRKESATTVRFEARDQHGRDHVILERTVLSFKSESGAGMGAEPKRYLLAGRPLDKLDENTFELPDGSLRLQRL